ncbi:MAG: hypothetical protein ACK4SY_03195 [Pyrobaculum sp.]
MTGLLAFVIIAIVTAVALRRVRDRVLTALAVAGLVLLSIPAVLTNGDLVERLVAIVYIYAPYWEYLVPLAFFIAALLPKGQKRKRNRSVVTV